MVGSALDSADSLVDIIELAFRAFGTEVVDQVETGLADASVQDEVFVLGTDGSTDAVAALTTHFFVALNAVAALTLVVVNLSLRVALGTKTVDQVVARKAAAGTDGGVPDFMDLAVSSADTVGGVIDLSGRAKTARVSNKVVSLLADALSVLIDFVGVACRGAEAKVFDVSLITGAGFGDGVVGGVKRAGVTDAIAHFEVLREADALPDADVVDVHGSAGNSANAKSLIINFIPFALTADAVNGVVSGFTAALAIEEDLIDSASDHTSSLTIFSVTVRTDTSLGLSIIGRISTTLLAFTIDAVVGTSTSALSSNNIINFIHQTRNTADSQGSVIESVGRAHLANTCN